MKCAPRLNFLLQLDEDRLQRFQNSFDAAFIDHDVRRAKRSADQRHGSGLLQRKRAVLVHGRVDGEEPCDAVQLVGPEDDGDVVFGGEIREGDGFPAESSTGKCCAILSAMRFKPAKVSSKGNAGSPGVASSRRRRSK